MKPTQPLSPLLQLIANFSAWLNRQPPSTEPRPNSGLGSILGQTVSAPQSLHDKQWEQFRWDMFFGESDSQDNNPFNPLNKPVNNRRRRPEWAKDDWELAQRVIGKPALIARMEWRQNMNPADIAKALAMEPATVQKTIVRMGNDVKRLGLREGFQVGGSISRCDFALLELKEMGMSDSEAANHLMNRWLGEHAVNRYRIAVMFWQWNMSMIDIAEKLGMSVGAVEQVIHRLQGEEE